MININKEQLALNAITRSIVLKQPIEISTFEGLNWGEFFKITKKNKVFPVVYQSVKSYIPMEYLERWDHEYGSHVNKIDNLVLVLKDVNSILSSSGIPYSVMKGLSLSKLLFNDLYLRHSSDIDLLFPDPYTNRAFNVLTDYGYFSVIGEDNAFDFKLEEGKSLQLPYPILKNSDHHEFFELWKKVDSNFYGVEIQRYLHGTVKELSHIQSFIQSNTLIEINDISVPTFDLPHTLLCLCENAFAELTESRMNISLKNYLDLGMFIKTYGNTLDWNVIASLANEYKMGHVMIQSLSFVNSFYGDLVTSKVIDLFEARDSLNNWRYSIEEMLAMEQKDLQTELKLNMIHYLSGKNLPEIKSVNNDEIQNIDQYHRINIKTDKFELKIRYQVSIEGNKLRYYVYFDNSALQLLIQHPLMLSFVDSGSEMADILNHFQIGWDAVNRVPFVENEGLNTGVPILEMQGKKVMVVDIPIDMIMKQNFQIQDKLIFKFSVQSKPYFNIVHCYDTLYFPTFVDLSTTIRL